MESWPIQWNRGGECHSSSERQFHIFLAFHLFFLHFAFFFVLKGNVQILTRPEEETVTTFRSPRNSMPYNRFGRAADADWKRERAFLESRASLESRTEQPTQIIFTIRTINNKMSPTESSSSISQPRDMDGTADKRYKHSNRSSFV